MPDLREIFETVKRQAEPDRDSWAEQERRMRSAQRRRTSGAIAWVAVVAAALIALTVTNLDERESDVAPASNGPIAHLPAGSELALVDLATGSTTGTGIAPAGSEVDVSPDGAKITYVDTSVGYGEVVYVADTDGSNARAYNRTGRPGGAVAPRWSPDGTKIVYQAMGAGDSIGNLYVFDLTNGDVQQITHLGPISAGLYYMAPTFSADGRSVLFTKPTRVGAKTDASHLRWDICSVPAEGGRPALVERNAIGADAQPGGDLIAFSKVDSQGHVGGVYVARSDGSDARKIADGGTWLPRWSPDGSQIGYSDDSRDGTFVAEVATGQTRRVFGSAEWPEWVNGDTMIVDLSD
jgi:dipeptidyl aminopeptidase/acylaminoacyl peptidase